MENPKKIFTLENKNQTKEICNSAFYPENFNLFLSL